MRLSIALMLAAVLAFVTQSSAAVDQAWLIVVDDLHIKFVNTGRLRSLLRAVATELIHDDDLYQLLATGPSTTTPLTADRELLEPAIKGAAGNGLRAADTVGAANEVLYRANTALDTALEAVWAFGAGDGQRKAIIYVSGGYDIDAFPGLADRVSAFARRAREDGITIFAIDTSSFAEELQLAPPVDPAVWQRHTTATRLSLTMIAEQAGGFVIQADDPGAGLRRINIRMR